MFEIFLSHVIDTITLWNLQDHIYLILSTLACLLLMWYVLIRTDKAFDNKERLIPPTKKHASTPNQIGKLPSKSPMVNKKRAVKNERIQSITATKAKSNEKGKNQNGSNTNKEFKDKGNVIDELIPDDDDDEYDGNGAHHLSEYLDEGDEDTENENEEEYEDDVMESDSNASDTSFSSLKPFNKLKRTFSKGSYGSLINLFKKTPWAAAIDKFREHQTFRFVKYNTMQGDGLKSIFSTRTQTVDQHHLNPHPSAASPSSASPTFQKSDASGISNDDSGSSPFSSRVGLGAMSQNWKKQVNSLSTLHRQALGVLRQIEIFSWMNDSHLKFLAKKVEIFELEQEKYIYEHGVLVNTPSTMILMSGAVDVYFTSECMNSRKLYIDDAAHKVKINQGKFITGLSSLISTITQQPTEAIGTAVVSSANCTIMKIKYEHLLPLFNDFYGFKEEFLQRLLVRLHRVSFSAFFRVSGQFDIHVDRNEQRRIKQAARHQSNPTVLALIGNSTASPYMKIPERRGYTSQIASDNTAPFSKHFFFDQVAFELGITVEDLQLKDAEISFPNLNMFADATESDEEESRSGFGFISPASSNPSIAKMEEASGKLTRQQQDDDSHQFPIRIFHFEDGADIIHEQKEPSIYIVLHGRLEIVASEYFSSSFAQSGLLSSHDTVQHTLYAGDSIGHLLLLTGEWSEWCQSKTSARSRIGNTQTITWLRANGDLYVAQIPSQTYFHLVTCFPQIVEDKARRVITSLNQYIRLIDLTSTWKHMAPNELLFHEGEKILDIYIVLHGRLRAVKTKKMMINMKEKVETYTIREYSRGAIIGEVSLFTEQPIMVNISSTRNSELAGIPRSVLLAISHAEPKTMLYIGKIISSGISRSLSNSVGDGFDFHDSKAGLGSSGTKGRYSISAKAVAIVPASPTVPIEHFTHTLVSALRSSENDVEVYGSKSFSMFVESQHRNMDSNYSSSLNDGPEDMDDENYYGYDNFDGPGSPGAPTTTTKQIFEKAMVLSWLNDREDENDIVIYQVDPWVGPSRWSTICLEQADVILFVANVADDPRVSDLELSLESVNTSAYRELVLLHIQSKSSQKFSLPEPINTRQWIENRRGISRHHHVRFHANNTKIDIDHYQSDFRRLGRFITGKAIGLALGGGGAKGFSHMSVIRTLHKHQIPIDVIGGTSIGAYMGGLYAMKGEHEGMEEIAKRFADDMSSIPRTLLDIDLTIPFMAYTRGSSFNRVIMRTFSDKKIEDMWINFFCMSTDLTDSCEIAHRNGSAWKYIRASMSLTGYVPPICDSVRTYVPVPVENKNLPPSQNPKKNERGDYYIEKVHYLVDGGYTNIVPVDVMRSMVGPSGTIIAVDITAETSFSYDNFGDDFSGFWYFMKYLNPFQKAPNVPWGSDIQTQLAFVTSMRQFDRIQGNTRGEEDEWNYFGGPSAYKIADLFLSPPVKAYSTLDFWKCNEIAEKSMPYCQDMIGTFVKQLIENQDNRLPSWSKIYRKGTPAPDPLNTRMKARRSQSVLRLNQQQQPRLAQTRSEGRKI